MNLGNMPESKNFVDSSGQQSLFTKIGSYLLKHGIIKDATGHPYQEPWHAPTPSRPGDWPTVGTPGGDIQWGTNKPGGVGLMSSAASRPNNDALARSMGFPNAATMLAWQQRQREMRRGPATPPGGGNFLNQILNSDTAKAALAIHPAYLYQSILDKMNGAMQ